MKKFLEGFFLMFSALALFFGLPLGWAILAQYFGYDKGLGVVVGLGLLLCIGTGLVSWANDGEKMKYKVEIGNKEFTCNSVSHTRDADSIIVTMDGLDSRVAIGTPILISVN